MFHSCLFSALVTVASLALATDAQSADWPMWRNDEQRSASSSSQLPEVLHLQWTRQLAAPVPAWPNEARLHFDASYEPIVLGSRMFVGSMIDGSVIALDTRSGEELWRFYTNGPVRLAPVAFDRRVCFGSDDGWLYCVDAVSGKLQWKVCGSWGSLALGKRPTRFVLAGPRWTRCGRRRRLFRSRHLANPGGVCSSC